MQNLIHSFKYRGKYEIGMMLGEMFAADLKSSAYFKNINTIIPVPLHWTKLKTRGFNQSEVIARGMAKQMNAQIENDVLIRRFATDTQTKKSRLKRVENVQGKFGIQNPEKIAGKHVLLIDDIITTGSTIEECANILLSVDETKVSIASIGFASK